MSLKAGGWSPSLRALSAVPLGSQALVTIRRDPADESFHEMAQASKSLCTRSGCCANMANGNVRPGEELETLADCLGDDHDW